MLSCDQTAHVIWITCTRSFACALLSQGKMNEGPLLLSPTFPPPLPMVGAGFGSFETRVRKNIMKKTVDYQASTLRYIEVCVCIPEHRLLLIKLYWLCVLESDLAKRQTGPSSTSARLCILQRSKLSKMMRCALIVYNI